MHRTQYLQNRIPDVRESILVLIVLIVPLLSNGCIPTFWKVHDTVRSVEQLSCLTRRVAEADRSCSVEKHTLRMLIFNFGNRSKSGGLMSGL